MIFMIELGRVVSSVTTMGTVVESRRESVDMMTENRKRKFEGGYVDRQIKKLKLDEEEDTNQPKVSTIKNKWIYDLQSSDASIVLEPENPTNVFDKWNDVVKVCSNNLEKLSLKDKIQKFGGRAENKENEHPVESVEKCKNRNEFGPRKNPGDSSDSDLENCSSKTFKKFSFVKNSDQHCEVNLNVRKEMTFQEKLAKFRKLNTKPEEENMGGGAVTQPLCTGTSKDARKCAKPIANQLRFGPIEWGENGQVTRKPDGKQL